MKSRLRLKGEAAKQLDLRERSESHSSDKERSEPLKCFHPKEIDHERTPCPEIENPPRRIDVVLGKSVLQLHK